MRQTRQERPQTGHRSAVCRAVASTLFLWGTLFPLMLVAQANSAESVPLGQREFPYLLLVTVLSLALVGTVGWAFRLLARLRNVSDALDTATARLSHDTEAIESDLLATESRQRMLFEQLPIGLALCRLNGDLIDVNPAFAQLLGRTVEETLQLTYWAITPASATIASAISCAFTATAISFLCASTASSSTTMASP